MGLGGGGGSLVASWMEMGWGERCKRTHRREVAALPWGTFSKARLHRGQAAEDGGYSDQSKMAAGRFVSPLTGFPCGPT